MPAWILYFKTPDLHFFCHQMSAVLHNCREWENATIKIPMSDNIGQMPIPIIHFSNTTLARSFIGKSITTDIHCENFGEKSRQSPSLLTPVQNFTAILPIPYTLFLGLCLSFRVRINSSLHKNTVRYEEMTWQEL